MVSKKWSLLRDCDVEMCCTLLLVQLSEAEDVPALWQQWSHLHVGGGRQYGVGMDPCPHPSGRTPSDLSAYLSTCRSTTWAGASG